MFAFLRRQRELETKAKLLEKDIENLKEIIKLQSEVHDTRIMSISRDYDREIARLRKEIADVDSGLLRQIGDVDLRLTQAIAAPVSSDSESNGISGQNDLRNMLSFISHGVVPPSEDVDG